MTRETKRDTPLSLILELAAEYHSLRWQCVNRALLTWRGDTSSAPRGAFSGVTSGWFRYVCTDCLCPASAPRDVVTLLALMYLLVLFPARMKSNCRGAITSTWALYSSSSSALFLSHSRGDDNHAACSRLFALVHANLSLMYIEVFRWTGIIWCTWYSRDPGPGGMVERILHREMKKLLYDVDWRSACDTDTLANEKKDQDEGLSLCDKVH